MSGQPQKISEEFLAKFNELCNKPYHEQAKWFLNAFWSSIFENDEKERESVWVRTAEFIKLDWVKKQHGSDLNEALFHKFLENLGETLTVLEARAKLRTIDINLDGKVSISEYLLFRYNKDVAQLVQPQANPEEVKRALEIVAAAQEAVTDLRARLQEQKDALVEVQAAEFAAVQALNELKAVEEAHAKKIAELEAKSTTGGVVTQGKAKAELAVLRAEDPLPLRRAKITQEASVRRVEAARKEAEAKTAAAEAAAGAAEAKLDEATKYLEDVKSRVGSNEGTFWWLDREMTEARKYLPQKQQRAQQ